MGIGFLEPNRPNRLKRIVMGYMIVMQFIVTAIGMSLLGYWIGRRIDETTELSTILAAIGLGIGVFSGFVIMVRMIKSEERYERSSRH